MERLEDRGTSGGERADAVDHCLASIARLSNEVKDAASYIPAYDQRTYGDAIKALSSKLQDIRSAFAPRQKFSFKYGPSFTAKKNASAISLGDAAQMASERRSGQTSGGYLSGDGSNESSFATTPAGLRSPNPEDEVVGDDDEDDDDEGEEGRDVGGDEGADANATTEEEKNRTRQPSFSQATSVSISNHDGLHIILPQSASRATSSGTLSMLHRCIVDMSSPTTSTGRPFAGLTLKNIQESLIICGHVHGAVHLTNLTNCIVVVASRQFRMHGSRNCDVYLLTTSRPIIEDCSGIKFAPLPECYVAESDREVENQWQQVDDFKWLRTGEQSPNWSFLPEGQRVREEVWREVVPGGPGVGTEDVLRAVRLPK